jgi:hypothetical protein
MKAFKDVAEPLEYVVYPVTMLEYVTMMQSVFALEKSLSALGWTADKEAGCHKSVPIWSALYLIHDTLRYMRLVVPEVESKENSLAGWGWAASGLGGLNNGRYHNVERLIGRLAVGSQKLRKALGITKIDSPASVQTPEAPPPIQKPWKFSADWHFDPETLTFSYKGGKTHKLTPQKFHLLNAFVFARNQTLSRQEIVEACGNPDSVRYYTYVHELNNVLVERLKLRDGPIKPTEHGSGYHELVLPS